MTDSQRFQELLDCKNTNPNELSILLKRGRSQGLYDILKGKIGISKKMSVDICELYPDVNQLWLLTGEGEMLKTEAPKIEPQQTSENVMMPRDVLELLLSQQKTIEAQQRITEAQQGNFAKLTEVIAAQQQTISDLAKKGELAGNAKVAVG